MATMANARRKDHLPEPEQTVGFSRANCRAVAREGYAARGRTAQ